MKSVRGKGEKMAEAERWCTCNPPCTTRALKRAAHGTPSEFERAAFNALLRCALRTGERFSDLNEGRR